MRKNNIRGNTALAKPGCFAGFSSAGTVLSVPDITHIPGCIMSSKPVNAKDKKILVGVYDLLVKRGCAAVLPDGCGKFTFVDYLDSALKLFAAQVDPDNKAKLNVDIVCDKDAQYSLYPDLQFTIYVTHGDSCGNYVVDFTAFPEHLVRRAIKLLDNIFIGVYTPKWCNECSESDFYSEIEDQHANFPVMPDGCDKDSYEFDIINKRINFLDVYPCWLWDEQFDSNHTSSATPGNIEFFEKLLDDLELKIQKCCKFKKVNMDDSFVNTFTLTSVADKSNLAYDLIDSDLECQAQSFGANPGLLRVEITPDSLEFIDNVVQESLAAVKVMSFWETMNKQNFEWKS